MSGVNTPVQAARRPSLNAVDFPAPPRRVARVDVPEVDRPKEHLPSTFRLRLSGWNAASVRPDVLAAILLDEGLLKTADV